MQSIASQHQQSKLSSSVARTLMETGAIHVELLHICLYSHDGKILRSPRPCRLPIPKVEAAPFKEFKWLRAYYLGKASFVFSKCSTSLGIYERKCFSEHPSGEKCKAAQICGVVFVLSFCVIYFLFICIALKWNHSMIINFQGSRRREVYNVVSM